MKIEFDAESIEWLLDKAHELEELKALHVTKWAVAMQRVCEAAEKVVEFSYNAPEHQFNEEILERLKDVEQALKELDEVKD